MGAGDAGFEHGVGDRLGDVFRGDQVGAQPVAGQRGGGLRADGHQADPGEVAGVAGVALDGLPDQVDGVGAREDGPATAPARLAEPGDRGVEVALLGGGLDGDDRDLHRIGAHATQPRQEAAGLGTRPGDHDAAPVQRPPLEPLQPLPQGADPADHGDHR